MTCVCVCVCSSLGRNALVVSINHSSPPYSCDSIEKLRKKCENCAMEKELKEALKFKDFYQFTFNFAKNPGQKGLGVLSLSLSEF